MASGLCLLRKKSLPVDTALGLVWITPAARWGWDDPAQLSPPPAVPSSHPPLWHSFGKHMFAWKPNAEGIFWRGSPTEVGYEQQAVVSGCC